MAAQFIQGDKNVQIQGAYGSTFNITFNEVTRAVPLERATVPAAPDAKSPARLMRARSGVVPFAARKDLRDELIEWLDADTPFAGAVIGGAGGTGKTRLAVEVCNWAEEAQWLSGILTQIEDPASLEALAEAPISRLIAVDYAESRAEQLKVLLPLLASRATPEAPVRVLLLVRAGPRHTTDWAESLRNQSDLLDNLLDQCETHVLEELPLEAAEREELFEAAAGVFAERNGVAAPAMLATLQESSAFTSPLLVVLVAYLAVHGDAAPPHTREELLRAVLLHEERYWRSSSGNLFADQNQRRHVIALVTLLSAESEEEAVARLRILSDFADAPAERLGLIARWAAKQYPGTSWWNPLEPDLVGEQLVADSFSKQPAVLSGALASAVPKQLLRPLEVFGRATANNPQLTAALQPILSSELRRLCEIAVAQTRDEVDRNLIYGEAVTLAAVLEKAIGAVEIGPIHLIPTAEVMPDRPNLVLNSLALTLDLKLVEQLRHFTETDPDTHEPNMAVALNNLSVRLGFAGRHQAALVAIEECVEIYRRLAPAYEDDLAGVLNNLSIGLAGIGRDAEALVAIKECVEIYRRLAAKDTSLYEPDLAMALNTLSNSLARARRRAEALVAIEEGVEIYSRLAAKDTSLYEPDLAMALNTLSIRLGEVGRSEKGLAAVEEAVEIRRRLAAENPAAHEPDLASALNNLSIDLASAGRDAEALAVIEECVEAYRRLAAEDLVVYESDLARALNTQSIRLREAGHRTGEGLAAVEEAVEIRRRLAAENPAAHEPDLAGALNNLSFDLATEGRHPEALVAIEESVEIYRRLAAKDTSLYEPDLAVALNTLSVRLGEVGRSEEGLVAVEEAVEIRRRLAAENPAVYESGLSGALNTLSIRLGEVGRSEKALTAVEEAVEIRRRLAAENPAVHERDLADALSNMSIDLADLGRDAEALVAIEECVEIRRRLAAENPAAHERSLTASLNMLAIRLGAADRPEDAERVGQEFADLRRKYE